MVKQVTPEQEVNKITEQTTFAIWEQIDDMVNSGMNEKDIKKIILRDVAQYIDYYFKE